jgi:DNA replication and repair protein RecF
MRLRRITLQHFRNIPFAELTFSGSQQFFVGPNAQGKTNLLEAIGFVTAMRSFRTSEPKLLITEGQPEAAIAYELEHETFGDTRVVIRLRSSGKDVQCDGERVSRMADYLGRFPTVVFSSQDQQLIRGAPAGRRRWVDLTLSAMDAEYLRVLQQYHRALSGRNALLRRGGSRAEIEAFEQPLSVSAAKLVERREEGIRSLNGEVGAAYASIAGSNESAVLGYDADDALTTEALWLEKFAKARPRDELLKSTSVGPHRDDYALLLDGRTAREFGSEGQQRSFVISLRLAELAYYRARSGVEPVLLADDVLGELDPDRRERFWRSIGETRQVIATGTRLPEADLRHWQQFQVSRGAFVPAASAGENAT